MSRKNLSELLPIGILLLIATVSIIQVLVTNKVFDYRQYIGLTLLMICSFLFFTNRKIYKYLFGITLILSTFNLFAFSTYIIGIKLFIIPIQIIPFITLMIYLKLYKSQIFKLYIRLRQTDDSDENEYFKKKIDGFKVRFSELNDEEIDKKLNQNLVPEAKKALTEIKEERRKGHYKST